MGNIEELGTKKKIMDAAKKLFGEKGFDGTSTRQIAALADVNLAGLNYHFNSKQELYEQVVKEMFDDTSRKIQHTAECGQFTIEKFVIKVFEMFLDEGPAVMEKFRIIILGSVKLLKKESDDFGESKKYGPMAEYLDQCIAREIGGSADPASRLWAVKVIVSFVELNGLRYHMTEGTPFAIKKAVLINDLKRLVKVVLKEIKNG